MSQDAMFKITPPQTTSFQISNDKMIESTFSQIIRNPSDILLEPGQLFER